tara:strand:- start:2199 stop:2606 length:408 start_codon:yes stop_codon:yes gene_type:complete
MSESLIQRLNSQLSPAVRTLGAEILAFDEASSEIQIHFHAGPEFTHSQGIVQGGFLTGMIDAAMALSVIAARGPETAVPSLEIKVSFIAPGAVGDMLAKARPVHLGNSTGFVAGELYQHDQLIAAGTSTVKLFTK